MGNYEAVSEPPDIISPLGVIETPDGGVRLVHGCSMPHGRASKTNFMFFKQHPWLFTG